MAIQAGLGFIYVVKLDQLAAPRSLDSLGELADLGPGHQPEEKG